MKCQRERSPTYNSKNVILKKILGYCYSIQLKIDFDKIISNVYFRFIVKFVNEMKCFRSFISFSTPTKDPEIN